MTTSLIPSHILDLIHSEREKSSPFYSDIYKALYDAKHISLAEWKETNAIMTVIIGPEFWDIVFDLTSFFLAESGDL